MELRPGETIVRSIRQHWFVILGPVFGSAVGLIALVLAAIFVPFDFFGYSALVYPVIGLCLLAFALYRLYIWQKNELIITTLRIINKEQRGIFNVTVTELLYNDITDVSFTQDGPMASTYSFGTLVIRLPSQTQVTVEEIPEPDKIMELINQIRLGGSGQAPVAAPSGPPSAEEPQL